MERYYDPLAVAIGRYSHLCYKCKHFVELNITKEDCKKYGTDTADLINCCDMWEEDTTFESMGCKPIFYRASSERTEAWIVRCNGFEEGVDYKTYINSQMWKATARKRMLLDGFKCQMCGTGKNLAVHHITYERLGHEDIDDLVTVCKVCHEKIHNEDIKGKTK